MDLFTYLLKKKGHNSSVNGDLFSYLLASRKRGTYQTYTGTQINVNDSINARMKNWILGGNTNQNGTPTPDAPIDIHNVIGENNVIENSGKNLYEPLFENRNLNGLTPVLNNDGSVSVSGTITQTLSNICKRQDIYLEAGTYTFSVSQTYTHRVVLRVFKSKQHEDQQETNYESVEIGPGSTKKTFTTTSKIYGWRVYITGLTANTEVDENFKLQVEVGSTATPFEKYKGKNYKVSLASRNLAQSIFQTTYYQKYYASLFVEAQLLPNTQYTLSFKANESGHNLYLNENISTIQYITTTGNRQSITFTTKSTLNSSNPQQYESGKGWKLLKNWENNTHYIIYSEVQLEVGDTSTPYVPYLNIELNKIGDYQDKIYKQNDKWYLEKNVRKYTQALEAVIVSDDRFRVKVKSRSELHNIDISVNSFCPALINVSANKNMNDQTQLRYNSGWGGLVVMFSETVRTAIGLDKTEQQLADWFNNNCIIYAGIDPNYDYPEITEITDDNLINQLEELAKARSFDEQTNITQLSEQLPFDLTVDIKSL